MTDIDHTQMREVSKKREELVQTPPSKLKIASNPMQKREDDVDVNQTSSNFSEEEIQSDDSN